MRIGLLVLVVLSAISSPWVNAQAQAEINLAAVKVEIWPEYDRPAVLVIYQIALSPEVALPASLTLHVPAGATVNVVAVRDVGQSLLPVDYTRQVLGDWAEITFTSTSAEFQLEYYQALNIQGIVRHIEYEWPGDYPVESLSVLFKQPVDVMGLRSSPVLVSLGLGEDSLSYYGFDVGSLPSGQSFNLSLDYYKTTSRLSASGLDVEPAAPLEDPFSLPTFLDKYLLWFIGIAGVLLVAFGLVAGLLFWRSGRRVGISVPPERISKHARTYPSEGFYCPQCGRRAQMRDRFCRACGVRLPRDEA